MLRWRKKCLHSAVRRDAFGRDTFAIRSASTERQVVPSGAIPRDTQRSNRRFCNGKAIHSRGQERSIPVGLGHYQLRRDSPAGTAINLGQPTWS